MPSVWPGGVCVFACLCVYTFLSQPNHIVPTCPGSMRRLLQLLLLCLISQPNFKHRPTCQTAWQEIIFAVQPDKQTPSVKNDIQSPESTTHASFFCFNQSSILTVGHVMNTCYILNDTEWAAGTLITSVESPSLTEGRWRAGREYKIFLFRWLRHQNPAKMQM